MAPTSAFAYVLRRSLGETAHGEFIHTWHAEASRDLQLNQAKVLHKQGMNIWHMDLEAAEDRYLLVGTGMGALHLYDVAALDVPGVVATDIKPLCSIKPLRSKLPAQQLQDRPGHASGVTSVSWYPVDNGMFVSTSLDGCVKVWDANELEVASSFNLTDAVHMAAFSPLPATAHLLAVGTDRPEVRLADISIGAATHRLVGHRASIRSLAWSNTNEFQLASGATDGSIRVWDIRRSGATACLLCLNQDGAADVPRRLDVVSSSKKRKMSQDPHIAAAASSALAHTKAVQSLAFTPDGRFLVSSGADRAMRLWNAASGTHMLYHPVGSHGVIASYLLHNTESTEPIAKYTGHYSRVTSCLYRASTRELVSGGEDGLIAVWSPPERTLFAPSTEIDEQAAAPNEDAWSDDDDDAAAPSDRFVPPILTR